MESMKAVDAGANVATSAAATQGGRPYANSQRINSRDLLGDIREIEIDHEGRIYRLRLTQSNKLILTA